MTKFNLRLVDGEHKAAQPWYDYLACHKHMIQNGGTLEQAQDVLFPVEKKGKAR